MDLKLGATRRIVDACRKQGLLRKQVAYVLATAYHETAHTMKPVREMGGEKYLKSKPYYPYVGMGYVQLTWLANYQRATRELGVDFVKNPRLLLQPEHAARILVVGMVEGWFTGKKLSDYLTATKTDFVNARRIINGTDKAAMIAGYAKQYDALLEKDGYSASADAVQALPVVPAQTPPPAPQPTPTAPPVRTDTILRRGSRGPLVGDLQNNLNTLGYGPLMVDEVFGADTEKAVMAFQLAHGLKVDGWAGGRTSTEIGKAISDRAMQPKLEEAEKSVPVEAKEEVKEKTGFLNKIGGWFGGLGIGGAGIAQQAFEADWKTVVAIGAVAVAGSLALIFAGVLLRRLLLAAFKDINEEASK